MLDFLFKFLIAMFWFSFYSFIHDFIIKKIYCRWKHKHKTKKRCYFWTFKKYGYCPLNYSG